MTAPDPRFRRTIPVLAAAAQRAVHEARDEACLAAELLTELATRLDDESDRRWCTRMAEQAASAKGIVDGLPPVPGQQTGGDQ
jgi:hypothetical protein